jgi:IS4 transposase
LAFFVGRTKEHVLLRRRCSHPVDKSTGVRSDQTVILTTDGSAAAYPDALRRVSYFDVVTGKRLVFLTNNFHLPALTIAQIYKQRWQVELFFKWIKQHLRIKAFYGTSENAVKTGATGELRMPLLRFPAPSTPPDPQHKTGAGTRRCQG